MTLQTIQLDNWGQFPESDGFSKSFLNQVLPEYLQKCRWFGAKNSKVRRFNAEVVIPLEDGAERFYMIIIEVIYETANTENFLLVLGKCQNDSKYPDAAKIATLDENGSEFLLIDALYYKRFRDYLFAKMISESSIDHDEGALNFSKGKILANRPNDESAPSVILNAEQSNTTIVFDDAYYLKIYRKLFRDANPDYELTYFLSEQAGFENCPKFAGSITWNRSKSYQVTIGLMQGKIENQGDAWTYMLGQVKKFYQQLESNEIAPSSLESVSLYKPKDPGQLSDHFKEAIGYDTIERIRKLAIRTAEMHLALYQEKYTQRFIPKSFNNDYRAWLLNRFIHHLDQRFFLMESNMHKFEGEALNYASEFLKYKPQIKDKILNFHSDDLNSMRIRIHGDYHLGQVILTEDDFYILDFEGEPEATIRDRKVKQPPMKDVAGMFRSFHYSIYATIFDENNPSNFTKEEQFEAGEKYYAALVSIFMNEYISIAYEQGLDIGYHHEIDFLLRYHILEKAIYELGYEINSRPDWVIIPLKGVLEIIRHDLNEQ
jgi:maltose alpha-D-glucosyltransferase/alpha-amylase